MEARYTEEAILARRRRNKRSGKSEARRQRWLAEQDVEWGSWWLAFWRWEKTANAGGMGKVGMAGAEEDLGGAADTDEEDDGGGEEVES